MNDRNAGGAHLMAGFAGTELDEAGRARLRQAAPAGVILFRRNIATVDQVKELTASLRALAKQYMDEPLLIAVDHEGGAVHRFGPALTRFPPAMALGAGCRADLAREVGRAMAAELLPLGITIDFAPVVDLLTDQANPQLLTRSFSDDPGRAGALAAAFIGGAQQAGLAATAKHFPGLGDCRTDSHLDLPVISQPASRFRTLEFVPFRAAVAAGVALVMTAHVAVPGLTGDGTPASLSRTVVTDILRRELGHGGVVASDALEMGGISRRMPVPEAAVRALEAGTDLVLCCRADEDLAEVTGAIARAITGGRLSSEELAASRARLDALRQRFGAPPPGPVALARTPAELSRRVAARAVWLRQDRAAILPLGRDGRVWRVLRLGRPMGSAAADQGPLETEPLIKRLADNGVAVADLGSIADAASDQPLLVLETNLHLAEDGLGIMAAVARHPGPVVVVSLEVPLPAAALPVNAAALAVFHGSETCQLAAADALLGNERPLGRSPFAAGGPPA